MKLSDSEAKDILRKWPKRTKSLWPVPDASVYWLQVRPKSGRTMCPDLRVPGSVAFHTQPDGLWALFGPDGSYVDIISVEVCGKIQNLNDKRSRYFPSLHSILLNTSRKWLLEEVSVQHGSKKPRWIAAGSFQTIPSTKSLAIPVRVIRVLYVIADEDYDSWCRNHCPTGYEFFCGHSSLRSYTSKKMQQFLKQLGHLSHFYTAPS